MKLVLTPEMAGALELQRREKKFLEDEFYPGAPTEDVRLLCEARFNQWIDDVLGILRGSGEKEEIFRKVKDLRVFFEEQDTEEREKVGDYIGDAMRAIGIPEWTDQV